MMSIIQPEGNLFKDRFLSLQQRALIEPRVPVLYVVTAVFQYHLLIMTIGPNARRRQRNTRSTHGNGSTGSNENLGLVRLLFSTDTYPMDLVCSEGLLSLEQPYESQLSGVTTPRANAT